MIKVRAHNLRRLVMLAVAAYAALVLGAAGVFLLYDRDENLDAGRARVTAATALLAEHAERSFTAIDLVLHHVREQVQEHGIAGFADALSWSYIQDAADLLPLPGVIFLHDAQGRAVQVSTLYPPPAEAGATDSEFFKAMRDGASGLYIGRTMRSPAANGLLFSLTRRLDDDSGRFSGTLTAGIATDYFTGFYRHLGLGDGAVSGLYRTDGAIIVRYPGANDHIADIVGTELLTRAAAAAAGQLRLVSPVDGNDRLMAFRRIGDSRIFAATGIRVDTALAPWRARLVWLVPTALILALVGVAGGLVLLRALDRQEQTMAELETMRAKAEKANQAKSRFMAAAGHDLRQPIQALRLFLGILDETLEKPSHRQIAQHATRALEASERLLASLLDATRLDAGAVRPEKRDVSLSAVLDPIASEAGARAVDKGLRFLYHPCDTVVFTDPALLERMVRNLVVNAIRYTDRGGVLLGCRQRGDRVRIEVWDTGTGIPPDKLTTIWEEFYQVGDRSGSEKGLGLGLSIVQRLGALLEHPTGVWSREGRGSVFSITLRRGRLPPVTPAAVPAGTACQTPVPGLNG